MKRVEEIDVGWSPKHPDANIHGMVGVDPVTHEVSMTCKTVEGKMCTGCCWSSSEKFMGRNCPQQIPSKGCQFELDGKPASKPADCIDYHCSFDLVGLNDEQLPKKILEESYLRVTSANLVSLKAGEIGRDVFNQNQRRIGNSPVPLTISRMESIMSSNDRRTPQLKRLLLLLQKESI